MSRHLSFADMDSPSHKKPRCGYNSNWQCYKNRLDQKCLYNADFIVVHLPRQTRARSRHFRTASRCSRAPARRPACRGRCAVQSKVPRTMLKNYAKKCAFFSYSSTFAVYSLLPTSDCFWYNTQQSYQRSQMEGSFYNDTQGVLR